MLIIYAQIRAAHIAIRFSSAIVEILAFLLAIAHIVFKRLNGIVFTTKHIARKCYQVERIHFITCLNVSEHEVHIILRESFARKHGILVARIVVALRFESHLGVESVHIV